MQAKYLIALFFLLGNYALGGMWTKMASLTGQGRHRAVSGEAYNRGYMGLGHVNGAGADISFQDWWEYDPATDSWIQKANYPVPNHGAVSFSLNQKIYVGGGSALTSQFYAYDPLLNLWSAIANCPLLPGDIQGFAANGLGFVIQTNQLAEYNPQTNSWALRANVPTSVTNWTCTFSNGSSGFLKNNHLLYEYKPGQNLWIPRANHPGLSTSGSYAFSIDGIGYVASGYVGGLSTVTEEVWSYHPAADQWQLEAEFPGSSRRFPVAFTANGKGYFGTGTNGINLNDFWEFDPNLTASLTASNEGVKLMVFPNPSQNYVCVKNLAGWAQYYIANEQGACLKTGEINGDMKIDLGSLASGKYFLCTVQNGKKQVLSFYVQ